MVYTMDNIVFDVGDMIIDSADKETGILIERYKIFYSSCTSPDHKKTNAQMLKDFAILSPYGT